MKYTSLKKRYPDYLSLDELRKVLKVSPKSARYLVEQKIIPAIDTGKTTWRYKISINDVIAYLILRDRVGSMIPVGAVTSRKHGSFKTRKSFFHMVTPGTEHEVAAYFDYIYADCSDVLTTNDIACMTGLDRSTVLQLAKSGQIRSIAVRPKYLIPKQYLLEFVVTRRFLEAKSHSELFKKVLGGFEIWKLARISTSTLDNVYGKEAPSNISIAKK